MNAGLAAVLLTADLIPHVTKYQRGYPKHMRCFRKLRRPSTLQDDMHGAFAHIAKVLDSWLNEYSVDRLASVYACMSHMRGIVLLYAVYFGRMDLLRDHNATLSSIADYDDDPPLLDVAAAGGNLSMVQLLHACSVQSTCTPYSMDTAASMGRVDIVEFLLRVRPHDVSPSSAIRCAAVHGHVSVLQVFHDHDTDGFTLDAMDLAAKHGHVHVLDFLRTHRPALGASMRAMEFAAAGGHFGAIRYLHLHFDRLPCGPHVMDAAAVGGHLDIVRFLHLNRSEGCTTLAMNAAATRGDLNMVAWLHAHRREGCTTSAMDGAATSGHLKVVKFLHTHRQEGCTMSAFWGAAVHGHVDIVQWLLTHKRPWCDFVAVKALKRLHPVIAALVATRTT